MTVLGWRWLLRWLRPSPAHPGSGKSGPAKSGPGKSGSGKSGPAKSGPGYGRVRTRPRGEVLVGTVWRGGDHEPAPARVVLDSAGRVARIDPARQVGNRLEFASAPPYDLPVFGDGSRWIGPAPADVHVHLARLGEDSAAAMLAGGVVLVRDLGCSFEALASWREASTGPLRLVVAGPLLTVSQAGAAEQLAQPPVALAVGEAGDAHRVVAQLVEAGVDFCRVILDEGPGAWPSPLPELIAAIVAAAHEAGIAVTARALSADMVMRALDAGVDEFTNMPTERLSEVIVGRLAESGVGVVSTLQKFFSAGVGAAAAANATALVRAGVRLRYGTDLDHRGQRLGIDPRELDRLAATGLGRLGALRAATVGAASAVGVRHYTGLISLGEPADLVMLGSDPLVEPLAWHTTRLVVAGGVIVHAEGKITSSAASSSAATWSAA